MNPEEAITLIDRLLTDVSDWQSGAEKGRLVQSPEIRTRQVVAVVFEKLTGTRPSEEQIAEMVKSVGMV